MCHDHFDNIGLKHHSVLKVIKKGGQALKMKMFTQLKLVFLLITLSTCAAQYTDDISEMSENVNDIFEKSFEIPAHPEACQDIPKCLCFDNESGQGITVDCRKRNLTEIPSKLPLNLEQLLLTMNFISLIPANEFKSYVNMTYLDLSYNKITHLGQNSFSGLENLEVLNLEMNQIRYMNIHHEAFKPLTHLLAINLQQDLHKIWEEESYPFKNLKHLTSLQQLAIDGIQTNSNSLFNDQSLKFKSLKTLQLGGINRRCNITEVSERMFENLPDLSTLMIQDCKMNSVQNKSFSELLKLENLDLSYNENLQFRNLANITYGLQFTNIKKLVLKKIQIVQN